MSMLMYILYSGKDIEGDPRQPMCTYKDSEGQFLFQFLCNEILIYSYCPCMPWVNRPNGSHAKIAISSL